MAAMATTATDRIEKTVVIKAARSRVWEAIADADQFGTWFGARFEGEFAPGRRVPARIVDPPEYSHLEWDIIIERVEPERLLSFRWHPGGADEDVDYESEPRTLVEFILEDVPGGTQLTVIESGFEGIPLDRRARAFESNAEGWEIQVSRVRDYVDAHG